MTGRGAVRACAAVCCAVRADQTRPPTSASVCAGASTEVSKGCQATFAVPRMFQPRPSGSESEARIVVKIRAGKEVLKPGFHILRLADAKGELFSVAAIVSTH